jgi:hypothetical protein
VLSLRNSKKPKNPKRKKRLQPNKRLIKQLKMIKLQHKQLIINLPKKLSHQMKKKMIQSLVLVKNMGISKNLKMYSTPMVRLMAKNKDMVLKKNLRNLPLKFLKVKTLP